MAARIRPEGPLVLYPRNLKHKMELNLEAEIGKLSQYMLIEGYQYIVKTFQTYKSNLKILVTCRKNCLLSWRVHWDIILNRIYTKELRKILRKD
jgi:hypothetical protein